MIAIYIYIFLLVDAMMISLSIVLDGFSRRVGGKILNVRLPFFKSRDAEKGTISKTSFIFQICNIVYMSIFVVFTVIDSFIYKNLFFLLFNFITGATLFITSIILMIVLSVIGVLKGD